MANKKKAKSVPFRDIKARFDIRGEENIKVHELLLKELAEALEMTTIRSTTNLLAKMAFMKVIREKKKNKDFDIVQYLMET